MAFLVLKSSKTLKVKNISRLCYFLSLSFFLYKNFQNKNYLKKKIASRVLNSSMFHISVKARVLSVLHGFIATQGKFTQHCRFYCTPFIYFLNFHGFSTELSSFRKLFSVFWDFQINFIEISSLWRVPLEVSPRKDHPAWLLIGTVLFIINFL